MKPETQLQIDVVKWLTETYPGILFTSTQAGDRRTGFKAMLMKRMGYTVGTPDLIVFTARKGWHGLLLELKDKTGQSDSQKLFMARAMKEYYFYTVAYGIDHAKDVLSNYLN
jgi:hypothetical protein